MYVPESKVDEVKLKDNEIPLKANKDSKLSETMLNDSLIDIEPSSSTTLYSKANGKLFSIALI